MEYDIDLDEFADEIEPWVIDEFKRIGCDTALSVLDLSAEELVRRTDLEEETVRRRAKTLKRNLIMNNRLLSFVVRFLVIEKWQKPAPLCQLERRRFVKALLKGTLAKI